MKTPILILVLGLGLTSASFAVDPPPDGGYPNQNTAEGQDALFSLTDVGFSNTAVGFQALFSNSFGNFNTAVGDGALFNLGIGDLNTAVGYQTLHNNTSGVGNTALGGNCMLNNRTGKENTAVGDAALYTNWKGHQNTATGTQALYSNSAGTNNVANGLNALYSNTTGNDNIAIGTFAGYSCTTGSYNIEIGNRGVTGEDKTIRIGTQGTQQKTFVAGISGVTVANGVSVVVDANGQLGVMTSSARGKEQIRSMGKASEAILSLQPVTFRYKKELDSKSIPQFGLVAEDVAKVDPDLVAKDDQGKPYTVRYEAVNAMLLNEFLKEHKKVEELAAELAELKAAMKELKPSQAKD